MNQYFLIAVIGSVALSAGAAESKPSKRKATRDEISETLRILPARRSAGPREERYSVPPNAMSEFRERIAALGEKADVVPIVAERLRKLEPTTEENEAELTNLVAILEVHPDPRALDALDRVASLKSPRYVRERDGMSFMPYPYAAKAKKLAEEIRIRLAKEAWQRQLAGLPESERVERISRYAWGIDKNTDELRRKAAADLLDDIDYKIWWPRLISQLPDLNAQDEVSRRKADWMPYWIQYGTSEEKSHPAVNEFIRQAAASQDSSLRQWANGIVRKQKK